MYIDYDSLIRNKEREREKSTFKEIIPEEFPKSGEGGVISLMC